MYMYVIYRETRNRNERDEKFQFNAGNHFKTVIVQKPFKLHFS